MPRYTRVIFPRDFDDASRLLTPEVARAIDDMPMLEPRVTLRSVSIDTEMLPDEALPDASETLAARALEQIRQRQPLFRLLADDEAS
jgi:hypothetical protein